MYTIYFSILKLINFIGIRHQHTYISVKIYDSSDVAADTHLDIELLSKWPQNWWHEENWNSKSEYTETGSMSCYWIQFFKLKLYREYYNYV